MGSLLLLSLLTFLTLLSLLYLIYKPPPFLITYLQSRHPSVLFHVPTAGTRRILALTIDDAPSASTGAILDLLAAYHACATFFVIGSQIAGNEALVARMLAEGHEVGNHAWTDEPSWRLGLEELERQIREVEVLVGEAGAMARKQKGAGAGPVAQARSFRPGSGFFTRAMVGRVEALGYRVVLGSVYPHDPQIHSARINARHVLSMVRPGRVVIMHDRRSYSVEQLELVLKGLREGQWEVESVGGLLRAVGEG